MTTRWRTLATEPALLTAMGVFLAVIAPYGTERTGLAIRLPYWLLAIVGGGLIGIGFDALLVRHLSDARVRVVAVAGAMTPFVTGWVMLLNHLFFRDPGGIAPGVELLWQVFVISLAVVAVRAVVQRRVIVERRVVEPPLPDADATFRRRLSAKRRPARLLAVEAYDHYVRVYTDAGAELVTLRFSDALAELGRVHGFRTHRSWWVAADAIEQVRWRKGAGEALLVDGTVAPVSRGQATALREAGWT